MTIQAVRTCDECSSAERCERRFVDIERRLAEQDGKWTDLWKEIAEVGKRLAGLEGRIAGYLVAASLLGTAVAFIAAYVFRAP